VTRTPSRDSTDKLEREHLISVGLGHDDMSSQVTHKCYAATDKVALR
jgi:hypothetical protein